MRIDYMVLNVFKFCKKFNLQFCELQWLKMSIINIQNVYKASWRRRIYLTPIVEDRSWTTHANLNVVIADDNEWDV